MSRNILKTIRFSKKEGKLVDKYLSLNQTFMSFSEMARVAVLDFIQSKSTIELQPITIKAHEQTRPHFLWDYDLTVEQVKTLLKTQSIKQKAWIIARILEHARFQEVFEYITQEEIREALPHLRMNLRRKKNWELALDVWSEKK